MFFKQNSILNRIVKLILTIMFIAYVSYLSYLTFFSHFYGRTYYHRDVNIIPLKTIILFLNSSFNADVVLTNILGNILAFVPMGLLLPIVFPKIAEMKKIVLLIILASLTVEVIQYTAAVGTSDIDDITLNFVGGFVGYILYRQALRFLPI